ncbi:MAG: purine-binding chemotaxis protein CheW [Candidatus Hydrogenedentes bacterium]|nr:purine-binding chemotaxis protein CheW [Candidatus Hydrogenedentota bacterium]
MTDSARQEIGAAGMAGKYLTFKLGPETYGIEILCVQEIIGLMPITRIPKVSEFIRGVINLRGKVIPVMSLSRRFGVPDRDETSLTCIIVIELARAGDSITMGVVVDEVSEVINIHAENIESPPDLGGAHGDAFLRGMGKVDGKVVILLDMARVIESGVALDLDIPAEAV